MSINRIIRNDSIGLRRPWVKRGEGGAWLLGSGCILGFSAGMPETPTHATRVSLRLELPGGGRIGPGKIALLEAIGRDGSIAAAARALGMSYPRALGLVEALDAALGEAAVVRAPGGARGGGAELTPAARALIARYRSVEAAANQAANAAE